MENLNHHYPEVERKISYGFKNKSLLFQAFTRSSYAEENGGESNEVLEFIGDRVLDFYVTKIIADRYGFTLSQVEEDFDPDEEDDEFIIEAIHNEGNFTELKKKIVCNKTLASRIDELGFNKYMFLGEGDIKKHVDNDQKVKADLFEAILGAIAVDSNWNPDNLENSVEVMLDIERFLVDVNEENEYHAEDFIPEDVTPDEAINVLQELAQHGFCSMPEYIMSDEQVYNQDGNPYWVCKCRVKSWALEETVCASSKKEAKKISAYSIICDYMGWKNEYV